MLKTFWKKVAFDCFSGFPSEWASQASEEGNLSITCTTRGKTISARTWELGDHIDTNQFFFYLGLSPRESQGLDPGPVY